MPPGRELVPHRRGPTALALAATLALVSPGGVGAGAGVVPSGHPGRAAPSHGPAAAAQQPSLPPVPEALVARLNFGRFRRNVATLAGFGTRFWSTQGNRQARDWIEAELASFGYEVGRHAFQVVDTDGSVLGTVDSVHATKVGSLHPDRMYLVSAHMDSINLDSTDQTFAPGANDDASGTAAVLEMARVFAFADIETDASIRFVLWNAEEVGLVGSRAYVRDRRRLQGIEDPPGSGRYPEPRWLGVIQLDMLLFDHGLPDPVTGRVAPQQISEADVDIEYDADADPGGRSRRLASRLLAGSGRYSPYPAEVGQFMQSTDSVPFAPFAPAVSVRENERRNEIGAGSDPQWHRNSDVPATYSEADFRLGLAALQTVTGTLAELAGARRR